MKKIILIFIPLLFAGFLAVTSLPDKKPVNENVLSADTVKTGQKKEDRIQHKNNTARIQYPLTCKSCHETEYPTPGEPGLLDCPRMDMITVKHSPKEGPETVIIDEMSSLYTGVVFPHRIHAEMSEMSGGCTGCHHYNTTGPVLNCRKCHSSNRNRNDITLPDLKAAYHRQCVCCHRQWSKETGCNKICHQNKDSYNINSAEKNNGISHPQINIPGRLVWQTNSKPNSVVTFYHNEHTGLFKIDCKSCHNNENCIKCHIEKNNSDAVSISTRERSLEEHHKPCISCHLGNSCTKCHKDNIMQPFEHSVSSGWSLMPYHSKLECSSCHRERLPYRKSGHKCISCHKGFSEKFDHVLIGLKFTEAHKDAECVNCHLNNDFIKTPVCTECHDDKSYPQNKP